MERIKALAKFPIIATNDVEEAEFQLSQSIAKVEIERVSNRHGFLLEVNEANLGCNTLHYNRFNADIEIKSGPYTNTTFFVTGRGVPTTIYADKERLVIRSVLFSAFRKARGYTPMEFLTDERLQSARERLLKSNFESSVALIALECGFINLGRFSQYYRKRFGELPSETLRKGM